VKCDNQCGDHAENSFVWPTSKGMQIANLCGTCAADMWGRFKHTDVMRACTIGEPLSEAEKSSIRKQSEELTANP
jgi:hypothetical protein